MPLQTPEQRLAVACWEAAATAAWTELVAGVDTLERADTVEIVEPAVPGDVGSADTAAIAGTVGSVSSVEVVDNAEAAAVAADLVAAWKEFADSGSRRAVGQGRVGGQY